MCYCSLKIIIFCASLLSLLFLCWCCFLNRKSVLRIINYHSPAAYRVVSVNEHLPVGTIGIISNVIIEDNAVYGYFRPTRFVSYPLNEFSHRLLQINGSCVKIEMICVEIVRENVAIWSENNADV